jgi:protocatechuate 3,4-dioxygenase beta subunit
MTHIIYLLLLLTAQASPVSEHAIEGIVVQAGTNLPIANARIHAHWVSPQRFATQVGETTTNAEGKFFFKGSAPGQYIFQASRTGYADGGVSEVVEPEEKAVKVRIELVRPAVIAGRVLDDNKRPRSGIEVFALSAFYHDGRMSLEEQASVETDDRGEYRLTGLQTGTYYVAARIPGYGGGSLNVTYAPGLPDLRSATRFSVVSGAEVRAADFALLLQPTFKITARVVLPAGWLGENVAGTSFTLIPRTRPTTQRWTMFQFNRPDPQGVFTTWDGVPPDTYDIYVRLDRARNPSGPRDDTGAIFGHARVEILDKDADAGIITMSPGAPISGQIRITSQQLPPQSFRMNQLNLTLRGLDGLSMYRQVPVTENGTFSVENVPKGRFLASVDRVFAEFYVESMRFNARESVDSGITVDTVQPGGLEISLGGPAATIQGSVQNAAGAPTVASVVLVPQRERRGFSENFRQSQTDDSGDFRFLGLRPGQYTLLAFTSHLQNAEDPDVVAAFENQGTRVTVRSGETQTVTTRVIAKP